MRASTSPYCANCARRDPDLLAVEQPAVAAVGSARRGCHHAQVGAAPGSLSSAGTTGARRPASARWRGAHCRRGMPSPRGMTMPRLTLNTPVGTLNPSSWRQISSWIGVPPRPPPPRPGDGAEAGRGLLRACQSRAACMRCAGERSAPNSASAPGLARRWRQPGAAFGAEGRYLPGESSKSIGPRAFVRRCDRRPWSPGGRRPQRRPGRAGPTCWPARRPGARPLMCARPAWPPCITACGAAADS